jgi:hypothetical protein
MYISFQHQVQQLIVRNLVLVYPSRLLKSVSCLLFVSLFEMYGIIDLLNYSWIFSHHFLFCNADFALQVSFRIDE